MKFKKFPKKIKLMWFVVCSLYSISKKSDIVRYYNHITLAYIQTIAYFEMKFKRFPKKIELLWFVVCSLPSRFIGSNERLDLYSILNFECIFFISHTVPWYFWKAISKSEIFLVLFIEASYFEDYLMKFQRSL